MRIISFPPAPMQAFWSAPVQALAPWINRIRHSLGHHAASPIAQRVSGAARLSVVSDIDAASNDPTFKFPAEMTDLPSHPMPQETPRSVLRVVRESDAAIKPDCAGRMVISGRMADVCAELDRMALQAAANTANS